MRTTRAAGSTFVIAVLGSFLATAPATAQEAIYWTISDGAETGRAERWLASTSTIETVWPALTGPQGLALDLTDQKLYVADGASVVSPGLIRRSSLDGTERETFLFFGSQHRIFDVALDTAAGHVYWTERIQFQDTGRVRRADLDGSSIVDLVTGDIFPVGIALDLDAGKMVFADFVQPALDNYKIRRADLDGGNVEDLVTDLDDRPLGVALDLERSRIYWTGDRLGVGSLWRSNLDGSNVELLVEDIFGPSLAVAVDGEHLYWTSGAAILRGDLDGEDAVTLFEISGGFPAGLAVVPEADPVPATSVPALVLLSLVLLGLVTLRLAGSARRRSP